VEEDMCHHICEREAQVRARGWAANSKETILQLCASLT
jgi:hypothetical protein